MVLTLPLRPEEEAKLRAVAQSKGVSADVLIRWALDNILEEASEWAPPLQSASGAALVAAMQASPHKDTVIESISLRLPVRDVVF